MPSLSVGKGLVATGKFAGDDGWAQLAFGQIVGGIDTGMIQEDQKMVALFPEPGAQAFLGGLNRY